jgi:hypothetical protein
MTKSEALKEHARNCEELADDAERPADQARFRRMADARKSPAKLEDWLEGKKEEAFKKSA